ncbi:MAG: C45 family autoproteolytic acyltransferase/hydrolase [bacterium]
MNNRKKMRKGLFAIFFIVINISCVSIPKNRLHRYQRSVVVDNKEVEEEILSRASLERREDRKDNSIKILHMKGTPYEMGFQHGSLLKEDIYANVTRVIKLAKWFAVEDAMDEAYDLMAPYIPLEEKEEMRGLAHGAGIPLRVIHWFHAIPEVSEYGSHKRFSKKFKPTSCSNIAAFGKATIDGELYQLRVLDWMRNMGVQKRPVILVHHPDSGNESITFSFAGFIGCVSGMNEQKMAFGEMGYGNPPGESLEGIPFVFLFRKLMREADSLDDAKRIIEAARRTCSYVYVICDAKKENNAEKALLFVTDKSSVRTFSENTILEDTLKGREYPALDDVVYGGAKNEKLYESISRFYGALSPETLKEIATIIALKSNMQNVIFKPATLEAWVSHATDAHGEEGKACNQEWFYFDFGKCFLKN